MKRGTAFSLGLALLASATSLQGALPHPLYVGDVGTPSIVPGARIDGFGAQSLGGNALAPASDVDLDGRSDVLIGAPGAGAFLLPDRGLPVPVQGRSYVLLGKALNASFSVEHLGIDTGFVLHARVAGDFSGGSVAGLGDFNGDHVPDLLIGAQFAAPKGISEAGAAHLVMKPWLMNATNGILDLRSLDGANGVRFTGGWFGDQTGKAVAAIGDINGDTFADLAIGAPFADGSARPQEKRFGSTYVVFGKGSTANVNGDVDLDGLPLPGYVRIDGTIPALDSGASLAGAGDVNGDGISDFLIGAPSSDRAFLIHGSRAGLGSGGLMTLDGLNGTNGVAMEGIDGYASYAFGVVSGVGDVDGDGFDDFLVGSSLLEIAPGNRPGAAHLVFGKEGGIAPDGLLTIADLDGTTGVTLLGEHPYDRCGLAVGPAGDVNGDGLADFLIGAPYANERGAAYLVFGSPSWKGGAEIFHLSDLDGTNGVLIMGESQGSFLGAAVAPAGDVDADGFGDFLVGAPGMDDNFGTDSGRVFLIHGQGTRTDNSYRHHVPSGNAVDAPIGTFGHGQPDFSLSRCWVSFNAGTGSGHHDSSLVTVTRFADADGVSNAPGPLAGVLWRVESERTGYTGARVTLQYLPQETYLVNESNLRLVTADSLEGPWTEASLQVWDRGRNRVSGNVDALPKYFALVDQPTSDFSVAFDLSANDWKFFSPGIFTAASGGYDPETNALDTVTSDNTNTFAFWESPIVNVTGGLAQVTYKVATTLEDRAQLPVFRLRTSEENFSRSLLSVVTSRSDTDFLPGEAGRSYSHIMTVGDTYSPLRLNLDVLNFDPTDAINARLSLRSVDIHLFPLPDPPVPDSTQLIDFSGNTQGFLPGLSPALAPTRFSVDASGLSIRASMPGEPGFGTAATFGYWGKDDVIALDASRIYRLSWQVESSATSANLLRVPTFRLRLNDSSLQYSEYLNVESRLSGDAVPAMGSPLTYEMWFAPPQELDGNGLILSFDLLTTFAVEDPVTLMLKSIRIETFTAN
jgi:hypothetical protein